MAKTFMTICLVITSIYAQEDIVSAFKNIQFDTSAGIYFQPLDLQNHGWVKTDNLEFKWFKGPEMPELATGIIIQPKEEEGVDNESFHSEYDEDPDDDDDSDNDINDDDDIDIDDDESDDDESDDDDNGDDDNI